MPTKLALIIFGCANEIKFCGGGGVIYNAYPRKVEKLPIKKKIPYNVMLINFVKSAGDKSTLFTFIAQKRDFSLNYSV